MSFAFHYSLQIISSLLKTERFNFFFFFSLILHPGIPQFWKKYICVFQGIKLSHAKQEIQLEKNTSSAFLNYLQENMGRIPLQINIREV